ncbi:cell division protein FtsA [Candidatus Uhrbacteria bacterium CG_4_10_14_0_2_um_filter_41_7]|uniref:Cell division protein FtsA n=1 Tax=Candidatus Uhrbacteria bacterium CG_4_9_14_3_um_filter_41_35 TaxID=1975034 RepID=A0A2M7XEJ8_9BACT|nr:MAG: cell division protein FtsA [Candidatus Uhrbacteria bacterium CG11_big_fil_rev_8_21_14_0_20_41_9]PIZ54996.1 MAG: cell division protein FtsA [Candidatus Uhrbacteria bacterium CG_4_10_14_0_2_um_filter_41_7]PJA46288.1 MAG: cell division protein FtsA [Candidatus Uhrbacteria bacterium CG_4_9_14_3_um_filter_41_35]
MADEIITGLDVGSSHIRIVIGQLVPDGEGKNELNIIGAVSVPAEGVHKGSISSMEDAVSSVSKALERAERMTGMPVNNAWISIAGHNILVQESRGVIGVSRQDGEIKEEDVERVIEAARTVATPSNYEILHVMPKSFTVDGQRGIKDPVGMNGIRLEVDAVIIQTLTSQIKNLTKSIYRTGLEIDDLVFAPLATAEAVLTSRQKELGVCVVDIGASSTTVVVFEEGDILHTAVLPVGGDHITNDIAIGLRTSLDVAEKVKIAVGHAVPGYVSKKDQFALDEFGSSENELVKTYFISEIIEARAEEIFEAVDDELRKIDRSGMLPVGVVLTGGGMKLAGMVEVAKRVMRLPAVVGAPVGVSSVIDEVNDPAYATAVGLAIWGYSIKSVSKKRFNINLKGLGQVSDQLRKWLKALIP